MKRLIQPAASGLLALFAMAWPWDVYQYVPWVGMRITTLSALGLIVLWLADLTLNRRNRVPFELAWPVAALLVLSWIPVFTQGAPFPISESAFALFFVAVCHFGPSGNEATRYLVYAAVSGTCVAVLSILAFVGVLLPTAHSFPTGEMLAAAHDIPAGILTLLVGLIAGRWFVLGERRTLRFRLAATLAATFIVAALVVVLVPVVRHFPIRLLHSAGRDSVWALTALVVTVWLAARVMAKLLIARQNPVRRPATVYFIICAVIVGVALCLPFIPRSSYVFLFAVSAACARAKDEPQQTPAWARWCWIPLTLLVVLNLGHIYPENTYDPRNYDAANAQDMRDDVSFDILYMRMAFFESRSPGESRTHLWRARLALEQGVPETASSEFALSLSKPGTGDPSPILPPPSVAEQDDFLTRLRDYCSSLPEDSRGFAYERALVAAGRDDAALAALRLRVAPPSADVGSLSSKPLAETLAQLLGSEQIAEKLSEWSAGELVSILEQWGVNVSGGIP